MKFTLKSFAPLNSLVLAGLLAAAGASVMAQPAPVAPAAGPAASANSAAPRGERMGRHDPAKMQAWMAKRQADMKATLKITPAQEGAWAAYSAAMQPPAGMGRGMMGMGARPTPEQRAEIDKLNTPQRIDKMRALRTQRMAEMSAMMDKRGEATKTLYAALSPEQQKTFDAEQLKRGAQGRHGGRDGQHGGHHPRG